MRIRNFPQHIPCGEHNIQILRKISILVDIFIYQIILLSKSHILNIRSLLAQIYKSYQKFCIREIATIKQSYLGQTREFYLAINLLKEVIRIIIVQSEISVICSLHIGHSLAPFTRIASFLARSIFAAYTHRESKIQARRTSLTILIGHVNFIALTRQKVNILLPVHYKFFFIFHL